MCIKRNVLYIMITFASLILLFGCAETDSSDKSRLHNRVRFVIGETRFNIERKYIKGAFENKNKVLHSVDLWVLLPDFESYNVSANHDEFYGAGGWGRKIYLSIRSRGHTATVKRTIKASIAGYSKSKDMKKKYGLEVYPYWTKRDQLYVFRIGSEPVVNMICSIDGIVKEPGCSGYWDYSTDVVIDFSFSKKYLSSWMVIWKKSNEILSGYL